MGVQLDAFPPWLSHGVLEEERAHRIETVKTRFGSWLTDCPVDLALALYPFAAERPYSLLDFSAMEKFLDYLEWNPSTTMDVLCERSHSVTHAIQVATRAGASFGREGKIALDSPTDFLEFETVWHPEYQRYAEHVLNHLLRVVARVLEHQRPGKQYVEAKLGVLFDLLQTQAPQLVVGLDPVVRNAISHGTVTFNEHEIVYTDHRKSKGLWAQDFGTLFDSLVDSVHGLICALMLFLCRNEDEVRRRPLSELPLGMRWLLASGAVGHPGFRLSGLLDAGDTGGSRLNVYCRSETESRLAYIYEALQVGYVLLHFGCGDYDRQWFSVDCGPALPAVFELKAPALRAARHTEDVPTDLIGANLAWHDTPDYKRRLYAYRHGMRAGWRKVEQQFREAGLTFGHLYEIREVKNASAGRLRRTEAQVVLRNPPNVLPDELIETVLQSAVRDLRRQLIRGEGLRGPEGLPMPPSYVWVRLHRSDGRVRQLVGRGWAEPDLLARAEWMAPWALKPIYVRKPSRSVGRLRIEMNPRTSNP